MSPNLKMLAVIFSVVLNGTFVASYAWRKLQDRPRFAYEEVEITADQRARFDAGRTQFLRAVHKIGNQAIEMNVQLIDLIAADPADESAIQAKLAEIRSNVELMQQTVVKHLLEDKQILNPEQRKHFFDVLKARIRAHGAPRPAWVPGGERAREQ
jgi:Spy/CpxP family protein refolding chaperone